VITAIEFKSVSKRYLIDKQRPRSFQELFVNGFKKKKSKKESLWVLKDVSFSIMSGEAVALIGPNGAGKSTILKLISSIIPPTSGTIEINGRVSSLLELGAGFHPDLSGRENIYLNGSILGLSRKEIDRKYTAIVDFADIGEYIELPVKHYSSGMYLRLAFAVASHMEPDILLIDEVIAVGDHIFQQRCLKRLAQLKQAGVTLILISHSMDMVRAYCQRGIWLENGVIQENGDIERVVETYLTAQYQRHVAKRVKLPERVSTVAQQTLTEGGQTTHRWGSGEIEITGVELLNHFDRRQTTFHVGEPLTIRMHYRASELVEAPVFGIAIYRSDGLQINGPNTKQSNYPIEMFHKQGFIDYIIEALNLLPGSYELSVAVYDSQATQAYDHQHRLYRFQVLPGKVTETYGAFYLPSRWQHATDYSHSQNKDGTALEETVFKRRR
jgi:lipopolysaccharide transport system ATP-binding protein